MDRRAMITAGVAVVVSATTVSEAHADTKPTEQCCNDCDTCQQACLACAIACLDETGRKECIRLCLDCADICDVCAKISARKGPMADALKALCADACEKCATECEKHKGDKACQHCAEQCRACAKKCRAVKPK